MNPRTKSPHDQYNEHVQMGEAWFILYLTIKNITIVLRT